MTKSEILTKINRAHSEFWEASIQLPNVNVSINGKWSVSQNVEHINISLSRLNNYLLLPKSSIESSFGLSDRISVSKDELFKIYVNAMANGAKATARFIPELNLETSTQELVRNGKDLLREFISNLQNWSEEELETYNCPHPILGKITVREILYFTIYHVEHHNEIIKKTK
jgi:hypothetical protein